MWWSAKTCGENDALLIEKFQCVLYHFRNIHSWRDGRKIHKCAHSKLRDKKSNHWLKISRTHPDQTNNHAFDALSKVIKGTLFTNALRKCRHFIHTSNLESYHNLRLIYAPKRVHYNCKGMVLRSILAVLDHNFNTNRKVTGTVKCWSKAKKCMVEKKQYEKKSNVWRAEIVDKIISYSCDQTIITIDPEWEKLLFPFPIPKNIRPDIDENPEEEARRKIYSRL